MKPKRALCAASKARFICGHGCRSGGFLDDQRGVGAVVADMRRGTISVMRLPDALSRDLGLDLGAPALSALTVGDAAFAPRSARSIACWRVARMSASPMP